MKILIASDKFKGSLSAQEVCEAIAKGIRQQNTSAECILHPMADGGDGTMVILKDKLKLAIVKVKTVDPLNREIQAEYLIDDDTAYFELAEASGMSRLASSEKNPLLTNTLGTGLLLKHAISKGYKKLILGLGGSCTTDAGLGIAHALGFQFIDNKGSEVIPSGGNLLQIKKIQLLDNLDIDLQILCDVKNPLYGKKGAAQVFGRQKGADDDDIKLLDQGLEHIANLIHKHTGKAIDQLEGGGSAGGIAAGLAGLMNAQLLNGFDYLSKLTHLEQKIQDADLVITGEGRLDSSSVNTKVVGSMSSLCRQYKKPLIAIVGACDLEQSVLDKAHIQQVFTVMSLAKNQEDAIQHPARYLSMIASVLQY